MAIELILIRHGQAVRNNGDYLKAPLTELGRKQAALTGRYLMNTHEHLDGFYSSPLRRARETAALIGEQIGCQPLVQNGLQEMKWVELPPLILLESLARLGIFNGLFRARTGRPLRWPIIGRVSQVLTGLYGYHAGQTIALVTHGGVISATLSWYMPEKRRFWWRETVENCSLTRLKVEGIEAELVSFNDIRHLKSEGETSTPDPKLAPTKELLTLPISAPASGAAGRNISVL